MFKGPWQGTPGGAHQVLSRYAKRLEREGDKPGVVLAIRTMLDHRLVLLERLNPDRKFPASAWELPRDDAAERPERFGMRPRGQDGSEVGDELAREGSASGMNPLFPSPPGHHHD